MHTVSDFYCAHLRMKSSLGISNFLEEFSSLSHSVFFFSLHFFALITEEGFLIHSSADGHLGSFHVLAIINSAAIFSLLLNMLFRLVITFLPRSKRLLISWLQSPSAVILEPRKIKSDTVSTVSPSISHEVMGPDAMILVF